MWNWLNCYFSGRHDFGVTCASGSMFLKCIHCGKRSNGWAVRSEHEIAPAAGPMKQPVPVAARTLAFPPGPVSRQQRSA